MDQDVVMSNLPFVQWVSGEEASVLVWKGDG
jgi:hypothetical protein